MGRPPNRLLRDSRDQFNAAVFRFDPTGVHRLRRRSVKPRAIPIFVVRSEKFGKPRKAILALHRFGAIADIVKVLAVAHPLPEPPEGDPLREVADHRLLLRVVAEKPRAHLPVQSRLDLCGGHRLFLSAHLFIPFVLNPRRPSDAAGRV